MIKLKHISDLSHTRKLSLLMMGATAVGLAAVYGCGGSSSNVTSSGLPLGRATLAQVALGQQEVTTMGCTDCHNRGLDDPSDPNWMAGYIGVAGGTGAGANQIGPFNTYCPNLTPDPTTGLGSVTDQQVYNALKYGLDPMATPDVTITSTTPGVGNFPATPHYLGPPMPWPATRHLTDTQLWGIVAYLKHGIKPVVNQSPASTSPPDFWASDYTAAKIGPATIPAYPSGNEQFTP